MWLTFGLECAAATAPSSTTVGSKRIAQAIIASCVCCTVRLAAVGLDNARDALRRSVWALRMLIPMQMVGDAGGP